MPHLLVVGIGGFAGAILRYLISGFVQELSQSINFPYGTFTVNMLGCFFIGVLSHLVESQAGITAEVRLLLMVGLLGSFTTFSTFGSETLTLLQDHRLVLAAVNIGAHIVVGITAVLCGRLSVMALWR